MLPNRKPPAPPGATQAVDRAEGASTPTSRALLEEAAKNNPEPTPTQEIRSQLLDAARGRNEQRAEQLARVDANSPRVDLEKTIRDRIESQENRRAEEARNRETEKGSSRVADERERVEKLVRSRSAANDYRQSAEAARSDALAKAAEETREKTSAANKEAHRAEKRDPSSGGASDAEKGDPSVNVVA